jgi:hypothetical protein
MIRKNRAIQIKLGSLLTVMAGVGVVLGVWKALSGFVATLTLFALMVSALLGFVSKLVFHGFAISRIFCAGQFT